MVDHLIITYTYLPAITVLPAILHLFYKNCVAGDFSQLEQLGVKSQTAQPVCVSTRSRHLPTHFLSGMALVTVSVKINTIENTFSLLPLRQLWIFSWRRATHLLLRTAKGAEITLKKQLYVDLEHLDVHWPIHPHFISLTAVACREMSKARKVTQLLPFGQSHSAHLP